MYKCTIEAKFEAAHRLPDPKYAPCDQIHGHSYKVNTMQARWR